MLQSPPPSHDVSESSRTQPGTEHSYAVFGFALPKKAYVGCLACQRNPLLMNLTTEVVRCEQRILTAPKPKKGAPVEAPPMPEWEVELNDTVLFPEGGGQPSDQGTIEVIDSPSGKTGSVNVREVLRRNLDAVHFVDEPLIVGSKVRVLVNQPGRLDKMAQHSGQHLLSAIIEDQLKLDTLSWSLSAAPLPCYIELPRAPTAEEIQAIQDRCNELIREGRRVNVEMKLVDEMPDSVPDNYVAQDADARKGILRTVIIENVDRNPCCGTHFPNLSHLQSIFILPQTSSIRGTNCRLSFLVGPRVLAYLSTTHSILRESSLAMNCPISVLPSRISSLLESSRDSLKREKNLRGELAPILVADMWERSGSKGPLGGLILREDDSTNFLEFLNQLSANLEPRIKELEDPTRDYLFILAVGATPGSPPSPATVVIVGSELALKSAGTLLTKKFGTRIKGGGKGRWQGKLAEGWMKGDQDLLEEIRKEAI